VSLLEVEELEVAFATPRGRLRAVNGLSFAVEAGETLAIVGESGSGKSVAQLALLDLLPPSAEVRSKRVSFDGRALDARALRGRELAIVFQDPLSALHPLLSVGEQLSEVLETHERLARGAARERAIAALAEVGIPAPAERFGAYPHELSGGMRSRVALARSLVVKPYILLMDEPFSKLDPQMRSQMHAELLRIREQLKMTVVFVTHDVEEAIVLADKVVVLRPRPGRVRDALMIDLPRPRDPLAAEVAETVRRVRSLI
jgi:NitT/TauT family transport system ATP-binding protein